MEDRSSDVPPSHVMAAKKGCVQCCGRVRIPPAGPPFKEGPFVGRYLCADCWTLYYDQLPTHLADQETVRFVAEEAKRIRMRRQASVLYEEKNGRIFLSERKTLVVEFPEGNLAPLEFDAEKLSWLMKAIGSIQPKISGSASAAFFKAKEPCQQES